jgi:hypothetical protein
VFTARYALSPYIKQIRFVFKGLILEKVSHCVEPVTLIFRRKPCCMVYDRGDGKVVSDGMHSRSFGCSGQGVVQGL